jgi:hypothetical protein
VILRRAAVLVAALALLAGPVPSSAAVVAIGGTHPIFDGINLGTAQTGNVDTTNTLDRGALRRACLLKITTTVGSTPTVTIDIKGSMDGTNFYNIAYAVSSTPETVAVAAIVITTATTSFLILRPEHPWRFLRLSYSANTNVTLTTDVWP